MYLVSASLLFQAIWRVRPAQGFSQSGFGMETARSELTAFNTKEACEVPAVPPGHGAYEGNRRQCVRISLLNKDLMT